MSASGQEADMSAYVIDDRERQQFLVDRTVMTDRELFDVELKKIFDTCWLYLGHDSEIPNPHDFRTREIAGRPVLMLRDKDGAVGVYVNSCPHRGAFVCREPQGNTKYHRCFYHSWTFDTSGRLVSVPDEEAYGPEFDKAEHGLAPVPRVELYRGFIFVSFNPSAPPLQTYLGAAREYLDLTANGSETGIEVVRGTHEWAARANWKLMVENSMDAYHVPYAHQRFLTTLKRAGTTFKGNDRDSGGYAAMTDGYVEDLGNGHSVTAGAGGGLGKPPSEFVNEKLAARRERIAELYGADYAARMSAGPRSFFIFPNLFIIDLVMGVTLRRIDPVAVDQMNVTGWMLAPVDEDPDLRNYRMENSLVFWGPAGLASPDDVEIVECCQKSYAGAREMPWIQSSRGMTRTAPMATDEYQIRVFWRRWNQLMTGEPPKAETHTYASTWRHAQPAVRDSVPSS
jgi:benzoate/toluate 1,2-dioxygenase alpha subunit